MKKIILFLMFFISVEMSSGTIYRPDPSFANTFCIDSYSGDYVWWNDTPYIESPRVFSPTPSFWLMDINGIPIVFFCHAIIFPDFDSPIGYFPGTDSYQFNLGIVFAIIVVDDNDKNFMFDNSIQCDYNELSSIENCIPEPVTLLLIVLGFFYTKVIKNMV